MDLLHLHAKAATPHTLLPVHMTLQPTNSPSLTTVKYNTGGVPSIALHHQVLHLSTSIDDSKLTAHEQLVRALSHATLVTKAIIQTLPRCPDYFLAIVAGSMLNRQNGVVCLAVVVPRVILSAIYSRPPRHMTRDGHIEVVSFYMIDCPERASPVRRQSTLIYLFYRNYTTVYPVEASLATSCSATAQTICAVVKSFFNSSVPECCMRCQLFLCPVLYVNIRHSLPLFSCFR